MVLEEVKALTNQDQTLKGLRAGIRKVHVTKTKALNREQNLFPNIERMVKDTIDQCSALHAKL